MIDTDGNAVAQADVGVLGSSCTVGEEQLIGPRHAKSDEGGYVVIGGERPEHGLALATTHTLVEGAGAAGLAGLRVLGDRLAGKTVGVVFSGANIDSETLRRILSREL